MEPELSADDLAERWILDASNWELLANKSGATRLGFVALLKFFEAENRFPRSREELPPAAIRFLADQVRVPIEAWNEYRWTGRTIEYHRAQIRAHLGYRVSTVNDQEKLTAWLVVNVAHAERRPERVWEELLARFRRRVGRVRAALREEEGFAGHLRPRLRHALQP